MYNPSLLGLSNVFDTSVLICFAHCSTSAGVSCVIPKNILTFLFCEYAGYNFSCRIYFHITAKNIYCDIEKKNYLLYLEFSFLNGVKWKKTLSYLLMRLNVKRKKIFCFAEE